MLFGATDPSLTNGCRSGVAYTGFLMRRWSIRLALMIFVIVWLIVVSFPFIAFILATNGEVTVGPDQGSHLRLFMVRSAERKGIGLERVRRISRQSDCFLVRVNYLLWEGSESGQDVDFCVCYDPETGYQVDDPVCIDSQLP